MEYKFKIASEYVNTRLDIFLLGNLSNLTRSQIKNLVTDGKVLINNKTVTKAGQYLKLNDDILVQVEEKIELNAEPENIKLDIIYEDDYLAVINKPQGMVVHPAVGNRSGTLVNALLYHFKNLSDVNSNIRPGIVHRLDKDTSGLIVIAKNNEAHLSLAKQIKEKTATRLYLAICSGVIKEDEGVINKNLDRSTADRKKIAVTTDVKGRTAITEYKVLERFKGFTYVEFKLKTGRTHQIRVHSKYIGHPVLGDETYGHHYKNIKLKGQLLHAYKLSFMHPITNEYMEFEAPLPEYFENMLKKLHQLY
ncbi:MAG: RluA family pseudouridine synthase [Spirochaetales bacterium]